MKTVGEFLRQARNNKHFSIEKLEKETRIKKSFIQAIEEERWEDLPEFPVVLGFIKNISSFLEINQKNLVALLRRDYPPKVLPVSPKPDVSAKFSWSPKLTLIAGITSVLLIIIGYLGFQYIKFVSPPTLKVIKPEDGLEVTKNIVSVEGTTDPDATIKVNNQPVLVGEKGDFFVEIEISEKTQEIIIEAISRSGKTSQVKRKIIPKFN